MGGSLAATAGPAAPGRPLRGENRSRGTQTGSELRGLTRRLPAKRQCMLNCAITRAESAC